MTLTREQEETIVEAVACMASSLDSIDKRLKGIEESLDGMRYNMGDD